MKGLLHETKGFRPLYFHQDALYGAKGDRIYRTRDLGLTTEFVCELKRPAAHKAADRLELWRRLLRLDVYRMRILRDETLIMSFKGGIFVSSPGSVEANPSFKITRGSRPVSLAIDDDQQVVFGEYFSNPERGPVNIYRTSDGGQSWQIAHQFPSKSIRHVHGISYDRWENCFWICTGDYNDENQLLRASTDFSDIRVMRQGGQSNRFYFLQIFENAIVTATDTPLEPNYITVIDKRTMTADKVAGIENTNFYGCEVNGRIFMSTNAEPSAVNDTRSSHLWMGDLDCGIWQRILSFRTDWVDRMTYLPAIPPGLFQYPRIFFPEGHNTTGKLVCYAMGLKGHHGRMMVFDPTAFDGEPPIQ
ncbi:MAG: hypothetical protein J0H17_06065 [Rhizobiales bacterium]|nr:hypothetical protein [Hyphomicrobiales bacterium]